MGEKFNIITYSIDGILGKIKDNEFVIPEIQRPFVWRPTQVRDLIDSLYNGYPTGYIITWKNPDVKTKDGGKAVGNVVLIDGQQRITALMAAIAGRQVLDDDFNKYHIKIAFDPQAEDATKRFEVQNASNLKDKRWIPDISEIFKTDFNQWTFVHEYIDANAATDPNELNKSIDKLRAIQNRQIGVIELDHTLDIEEVTEIFIRINSKGTPLEQNDFVMSKMAADSEHGGDLMRKCVDYFCHLAVKPEFYDNMKQDSEFAASPYAPKIKWLADDHDDIYDPRHGDMLRVSFMYSFGRARMADLVSLLSGRDFVTKEFREDIAADAFAKLGDGILRFVNEIDFKQFVLAIRGAGFASGKLLGSQNTLNFAYMLYLMLHDDKGIAKGHIKQYVQKWFVLSTLTSRYTNSPESAMDSDIRRIKEQGFASFLAANEAAQLSDAFWKVTLPQALQTSSSSSPFFKTFLAAQINLNCDSLLLKGTSVKDLVLIQGDVHHIFPKSYLIKSGITVKNRYNQVANYTYLDTVVNKQIGDRPPCDYFKEAFAQCETKQKTLGNITDRSELLKDLADNCVPDGVAEMDFSHFDDFLAERRRLMAAMIRRYYEGL